MKYKEVKLMIYALYCSKVFPKQKHSNKVQISENVCALTRVNSKYSPPLVLRISAILLLNYSNLFYKMVSS